MPDRHSLQYGDLIADLPKSVSTGQGICRKAAATYHMFPPGHQPLVYDCPQRVSPELACRHFEAHLLLHSIFLCRYEHIP